MVFISQVENVRFSFVWIVKCLNCFSVIHTGSWNWCCLEFELTFVTWNGWVDEHIWFRINNVWLWGMLASEWRRDDIGSDRYGLEWRCWAYLRWNGLRTELRWSGMTETRSIFGLLWRTGNHWAYLMSNGVDQYCGTLVYCGFISGTWSGLYLAHFFKKSCLFNCQKQRCFPENRSIIVDFFTFCIPFYVGSGVHIRIQLCFLMTKILSILVW